MCNVDERDRLRQRILDLEVRLRHFESENEFEREQNARLRQELAEVREREKKLRDEIRKLQEEARTHAELAVRTMEANNRLQRQVEEEHGMLATAREQLALLEIERQKLQGERNMYWQKGIEYMKERDLLRDMTLDARAKHIADERDRLQRQVEELETSNGFTRGTFEELYSLREQVEELKKEMGNWKCRAGY